MAVERYYLIDGKRINWRTLIKQAQNEGMEITDLTRTTEAADYLRAAGHTVEEELES